MIRIYNLIGLENQPCHFNIWKVLEILNYLVCLRRFKLIEQDPWIVLLCTIAGLIELSDVVCLAHIPFLRQILFVPNYVWERCHVPRAL